jgi:hypothetical protein
MTLSPPPANRPPACSPHLPSPGGVSPRDASAKKETLVRSILTGKEFVVQFTNQAEAQERDHKQSSSGEQTPRD